MEDPIKINISTDNISYIQELLHERVMKLKKKDKDEYDKIVNLDIELEKLKVVIQGQEENRKRGKVNV